MPTAPSPDDILPRITSRIQFLCGTWNSGVSSMLTILASAGTKVASAFSSVVFPEAVSPETKMFKPSPTMSERYAAIM